MGLNCRWRDKPRTPPEHCQQQPHSGLSHEEMIPAIPQICCPELFGPDFSPTENSNTTSVTSDTALAETFADRDPEPSTAADGWADGSVLNEPDLLPFGPPCRSNNCPYRILPEVDDSDGNATSTFP